MSFQTLYVEINNFHKFLPAQGGFEACPACPRQRNGQAPYWREQSRMDDKNEFLHTSSITFYYLLYGIVAE